MGKKIYAFANAGKETFESLSQMAVMYENNGADGIFVFNRSRDEKEFDAFLESIKKIVRLVDMPVMIGIDAERFEDIKKAFYTGASKVVVRYKSLKDRQIVNEAVKRFGADRIALEVDARKEDGDGLFDVDELDTLGAGSV
ncbi:MAG: bifunctional phosphoribosyl-AMP cyclohydrolase/phosphoribosyl-ATP pyrophosphatase, partial [Lachnospiraceae bacterium]|nr:bifunctional phosphoribosyl-AMP cyclohydrolase/phosphoribosyl-ATP pyrophosphatase [Lachnospiraceae bacterium]